jgi:CheY-like chemotaxis protein
MWHAVLDDGDPDFRKSVRLHVECRVMPSKRILSVGQCAADQWALSNVLERRFDAEVVGADTLADALALLGREQFNLILVNRILDRDGSSGLDIIARVKQNPTLTCVSIMLVSNFTEAQERAIALGALPGFGKAALAADATLARLADVLGDCKAV